jgi:hypothetical protein
MIRRTFRSLTAACLVSWLGVLHTGLPSHSHDVDRTDVAADHPAVGAEHHGHGTQLVEQAEWVQSAPVQLVATPTTIEHVTFPTVRYTAVHHTTPLRPLERAPPPGAPRAPPLVI